MDEEIHVDDATMVSALQNGSLTENDARVLISLWKFDKQEEMYGELERLGLMPPPAGEGITSVYYPALSAKVAPDLDLAATACPWLDEYCVYSRRWSPRAGELFHEAVGLWVLSTVAARRLEIDMGMADSTSLFISLCADSTEYPKTTTARLGLRLIRQAGLAGLLHVDDSTPQALLEDMSGRVPEDYQRLTESQQAQARLRLAFAAQRGWFYAEWGTKLAQMRQSQSPHALFHGLLRQLDDNEESMSWNTISRGVQTALRPYLPLLTNSTPDDIAPYLDENHAFWRDGFHARFAFIGVGDQVPSRARWPRGKMQVPGALVNDLRGWHDFLGVPYVNVQGEKADFSPKTPHSLPLSDELYDAYYDYSDDLAVGAKHAGRHWASVYARYPVRALRIAALLSSMDWYGQIGDAGKIRVERPIAMKHWHRAVSIIDQWRASHHALIKHAATKDPTPKTAHQRIAEAIHRVLARQNLPLHALNSRVYGAPEDKLRTIKAMERMGEIRLIEQGKTEVYELVISSPRFYPK